MGTNWYDGLIMGRDGSPVRAADFHHACVVVVSGDAGNPCGHALLHVGRSWYFHVAGWRHHPRYLTESGYRSYLTKAGKKEYRRWPVHIPNPDGAYQKLLELMEKEWRFLLLDRNCVVFIEEIVRAGGSDAGMYLNCPRLERFA